ncbi:MAG: alpha/beta hydrolase [Actinomycetota bacterium]
MVNTAAGRVEVAVAAPIAEAPSAAVLVVHGTPGDWRQGRPLAEDLCHAHRVLLPSRPGYGATPLSVGRTYDEHADAYAALMDALGIERCAVVGVSGGGPSAAAFASRHPDRTTALVSVCAMAAHLVAVPRGMRWTVLPGLAELLTPISRAVGRRRIDDPRRVEAELERSLTPDELARAKRDPRIVEDLLRHARSMIEGPSALPGMRNDLAQIIAARRSAPPDYAGVACPSLLLYADADEVIGLDHGRFYADALPGAQLKIIEGAGHVFALTRRRETSELIARFIASAS